MPLSNSQYDEIFRKYDEKQLASQHQLERRTKDVYARIPALKEIDDAIATCSVEQARRLLDGDEAALTTLREKHLGLPKTEGAAVAGARAYF